MAFRRYFGAAINQADQLRLGLGLGEQAHDHRDGDADEARPESAEHVLGHVLGIRRQGDVAEGAVVDGYPGIHADGGRGSYQQAPETSLRGGALPQHAQQHGAEQRRDEEAEQRLDVIHDALEMHHQVGRANADQHAQDGAPAAHADVVGIGGFLAENGAVDIVGPDGGESADVAGHAGHEPGDQGGDTQAHQARSAVARQHDGEHFVVAVAAGSDSLGLGHQEMMTRRVQKSQSQKAWKNHDKWHAHLEGRADQRRQFRRAQVLGGDDALHNQEVGGPVAHGDKDTQPEYDPNPVDAHGVIGKGAHGSPHMGEVLRREVAVDASHHAVPTAGFDQPDDGNQQRAQPDQNELQHFVET